MDSVEFDGVTYVRAAVAAKQFSYTQDYIGQLCRSKKIDARLVGRGWFVNPDSITTHKTQKFMKDPAAPVTANTQTTSAESTPDESVKLQTPDISKSLKTERRVASPAPRQDLATPDVVSTQEKVRLPVARQLSVNYEPDEESLLPTIHKVRHPLVTTLPVNPAQSKKVRIKAKKAAESTFEAEELPTVALSGRIKVKDIPLEAVDLSEEPNTTKGSLPAKSVAKKPANTAHHTALKPGSVISLTRDMAKNNAVITSANKVHPKPVDKRVESDTVKPGVTKKSDSSSLVTVNKSTDNPLKQKEIPVLPKKLSAAQQTTAVDPVAAPSNEPTAAVQGRFVSFTPHVMAHKKVTMKKSTPMATPVAVLALAMVTALWILSAGSLIEVSQTGYEASVIFQSPTFDNL